MLLWRYLSRTFYIVSLYYMSVWLLWPCHVTCYSVTLCLLCFLLFNNKKIRENKRKIKENKIETKSIVFNSDNIYFKATMYIIHSMILFLPKLSTIFHHGTSSCDSVTCDIPWSLNPVLKIEQTEMKKREKRSK